jgi:K+-transporting ATPase KdpF subunit
MCAGARSCDEVTDMNLESLISLVVSALLLVYLTVALLRPEKF